MALFNAHGKCSWFGGPEDTGVSPDEGLAFFYDYDDAPHLFLKSQPPGTTGLARRLDPYRPYVACRWDYSTTPKTMLADKTKLALVSAKGRSFQAWPADWGPHQDTGRIADLSPALMELLGIGTDDVVDISYPYEEKIIMPKIAISSGHSTKCQGAIGVLNEVAEATKVVDRVYELLQAGGVTCWKFHDTTSTNSNDNLNKIVNWHNSQPAHDYDVSVHFNAYQSTNKPMGTECLYVTQSSLAAKVSSAQAGAGGFINRGAKFRDDLFFLNQTRAKSILTEICFVDSAADAGLYQANFDQICQALAYAIAPEMTIPGEPPPIEPPPVEVEQVVDVKICAPPGVRVDVSINQEAEG